MLREMQTKMALVIDSRKSEDPRDARLFITGDLDVDGARVVRREFGRLIQEGRLDLTVNLDRVGFLDSSGLASLIAALRQARDRGGDVRVETSNERIRRVLEVTALSQVFKLARPASAAA